MTEACASLTRRDARRSGAFTASNTTHVTVVVSMYEPSSSGACLQGAATLAPSLPAGRWHCRLLRGRPSMLLPVLLAWQLRGHVCT